MDWTWYWPALGVPLGIIVGIFFFTNLRHKLNDGARKLYRRWQNGY